MTVSGFSYSHTLLCAVFLLIKWIIIKFCVIIHTFGMFLCCTALCRMFLTCLGIRMQQWRLMLFLFICFLVLTMKLRIAITFENTVIMRISQFLLRKYQGFIVYLIFTVLRLHSTVLWMFMVWCHLLHLFD